MSAHRAIFAELFWVPGDILQAEDRIHRLGQRKNAIIEYILASGPTEFDQKLWKLLRKKTQVIQASLDSDDLAAAAAAGYRGGDDDENDGKADRKNDCVISIFDDDEDTPGARGHSAAGGGAARGVDIFDDEAALNDLLDKIEGRA